MHVLPLGIEFRLRHFEFKKWPRVETHCQMITGKHVINYSKMSVKQQKTLQLIHNCSPHDSRIIWRNAFNIFLPSVINSTDNSQTKQCSTLISNYLPDEMVCGRSACAILAVDKPPATPSSCAWDGQVDPPCVGIVPLPDDV